MQNENGLSLSKGELQAREMITNAFKLLLLLELNADHGTNEHGSQST